MTALSVAQVAERWACSVDAVYDLIHADKLRAFKLGATRWRVLRSLVAALYSASALCRTSIGLPMK